MNRRLALVFAASFAILLVLSFFSLLNGSVRLGFGEFMSLEKDSSMFKIVWNLRFPRLAATIILGGALSVSGFLLQTFFNNPIAGPYVLGISSGAKLTVALTMILFMNNGIILSSFGLVAAAFAGSLISMSFVLLLSMRVRNMSMLVVCGIFTGYVCSAVTDFFVTFANDSNIVNLHNWSLGSFSGIGWDDVISMSLIVFPVVAAVVLMSKPIGAYQLGEGYARNSGVNIKALRILLILCSSMLSACVTAFAGPVSFVGIAVPHIVKLAASTAKPLVAIPACFFCGACVTLFCDMISRTVFAPVEMSISSVTAILLVPVVIVMMVRKQRER